LAGRDEVEEPVYAHPPLNRAVVTLCDSHYYPGLVRLHESIATSFPCQILCYDAGLSAAQREAVSSLHGITLLELPSDPLIDAVKQATHAAPSLSKPGKRIWPLWICPALINAAPARDVIWLDCDLVVLRGLDEVFRMLEEGPVFTPENKAPDATPNLPRLYELLPISRAFDPRLPVVNGGVSAWRKDRDDEVLQAYLRPVREACHDSDVRNSIAWHDQGALIWAIQSQGLEARVLDSTAWNLSVDNAAVSDALLKWDQGLLPRLRDALPDIGILHWNGRPVPWDFSDQRPV
jgi:hypothetical protein